MVKTLTTEILDELIEEEFKKYSSTLIKPQGTIQEKTENLSESLYKNKDVEIWIESPDGTRELYEDTDEHKKNLYREQKDKAIKGFQSYYRSLNTDQRYELVKFLKTNLIKELTLKEVEDITSRVISASKGLTEPQDKNRKPK
mgnify:CR=1 FL=1|jgi:hypothetical protein|tara:strand:+ start:1212 stop:1640 length:429 start_codon:yes stop_codon:yes gene_type:complete